jgi:hypothetical protein
MTKEMDSALRVVPLRSTVDEATVFACRRLLDQAEAGEIVSLLAICESSDGSRLRYETPCRDAFAMLADIVRLLHGHQTRMDAAISEEVKP